MGTIGRTALAEVDVPKALRATSGLIDEVGAVAAPAAVELTHSARPKIAPATCLAGLDDTMVTPFFTQE